MQQLIKQEILLTFPTTSETRKFGPGEDRTWACQPYRLCKPLGLFVWGATADTYVEWIGCGNAGQVMASQGRIPARFFETGRSFDEIKALADAGELELSTAQRQILNMDVLELGNQLTVRTVGPFENLVMWGVTLKQGVPPPAFAEVKFERSEGGTSYYRGRVLLPTFDGDDYEACVIEAPTSGEVATMLAPQLADLRVRGARW